MAKSGPPAPLRLYILHTGYVHATDAPFVTPSGAIELVTTSWFSGCYLLEHPRGWFLWDTGMPDSLINRPGGVSSGAFRFEVTKTLASHLRELGLTAPDIPYVGFSHMHSDHAGNVALFAASTLLVHGREYELAQSRPSPSWFAPEEEVTMALKKSQTIQIRGDYDVFGDGSLRILQAPGHTVGHQALLVQLPKTGPVLLTGDLYYSARDRAERLVPQWNSSYEQSLDSVERIEKIIADSQALLIIHHDQDQFAALPHAPNYLE